MIKLIRTAVEFLVKLYSIFYILFRNPFHIFVHTHVHIDTILVFLLFGIRGINFSLVIFEILYKFMILWMIGYLKIVEGT